jgi:hypothetical protein
MGKRILAVIGGIIAAMLIITLSEYMMKFIYPLPAGFNEKDMNAWAELMKTMPAGAFWCVIFGYAAGSFVGGMVASKVTGKIVSGIVVGAIVMVSGIMNLVMIPNHPVWFIIVSNLVYIPFAYLGAKLVVKTPQTA